MNFRIAALAITAILGGLALDASRPAAAAPLPAAKALGAVSAGSNVVEVGRRHHRRHRRHHRRHRGGISLHFKNGTVHFGHHRQHRRCRVHFVKVYDPFVGGYVYERRRICRHRF